MSMRSRAAGAAGGFQPQAQSKETLLGVKTLTQLRPDQESACRSLCDYHGHLTFCLNFGFWG
eukprot:2319489-Pleurochrysis_carterae.AAC.1